MTFRRELLPVLQLVERHAQPSKADWRTPHERGEPEPALIAYELDQFRESLAYLRRLAS
jgi:3-oxoisoapionate decarboxylase